MTFSYTILISHTSRMAEECNSHLVFLLSMTGCFKKVNECASHLVSMFLMISSVKEGKEWAGHLVFLFADFLQFSL